MPPLRLKDRLSACSRGASAPAPRTGKPVAAGTPCGNPAPAARGLFLLRRGPCFSLVGDGAIMSNPLS